MEEGSLGDECFDRVQERENEIACLKKKKEGRGKRRGISYALYPQTLRDNLIIISISVFFSTCVDFYIEIRLLILK